MMKVKVFPRHENGSYSPLVEVEEEVNRWITEVERRGAKIIQTAATGAEYHLGLWIFYEE